jgi:glycolate oxidase
MNLQPLIRELEQLLGADAVVSDKDQLLVYESDGFTIARGVPAAVVFPNSTELVSQVVKLFAKYDAQIIPRGSGTGLTGGCIGFDNGVIVSTARMNKVLAIDLNNRAARIQAGVRNVQLSEAVAKIGGEKFHFAPDPSSQRASTIGGNASTNAGGIHTLKDFVASNHVLGIEMVLADGSILTVGGQNGCCENGPFDLPGLVCGHEGTFGIITSLWVRLTPKAMAFRTMVATFATSADASATVSDIIATGILPAAMEMLDGRMVKVIEETYHLGLPPQAEALLLTEIDGIDELLEYQQQTLIQIHQKHHAISMQSTGEAKQRATLWKARKGAFGAVGRISYSYCTQDACVPRSKLPEVLARIAEIGRQYNIPITNVFHAGDGNVHPIFLYDERDEEQVQNTLRAAETMLKFCVDVGGTITGEHGVGLEKIELMPYQFDESTMSLFARVKLAFDPQERINAGKMIPSDKLRVSLLKPGRQVPQ